MHYKINDFSVFTRNETEKIRITIINRREEEEYKNQIRNFTVFDGLNLLENADDNGIEEDYRVINDLFDFIDLIEILKTFTNNKLDATKVYNINDCFTAKIVTEKKKTNLEIHFRGFSYNIYLDKFECNSYAAKFSKILQRCEAWQEINE